MNNNSNSITEFYDDFLAQQAYLGINERIYSLYGRLKKLGLNNHSNVLELGCGTGTMTYLLSKTVKNGQIEAVDISPKSVQYAASKLKQANIQLVAADIVDYTPELKKVDFITLFDIIEHVPMERHSEMFANLAAIAGPETVIVINLPNPDYIEYDRLYQPEVLQIIDQSVPLPFILKNINDNGLHLVSFKNYSIWVENDYQLFIITQKKTFEEKKLSDKRSFFEKAIKRLEREYIKLRYPYK